MLEIGAHTKTEIPFYSYAAPNFSLPSKSSSDIHNCWAHALYNLTGKRHPKDSSCGWGYALPNDEMISFLRKQRIVVRPLTICNTLSNRINEVANNLRNHHVILAKQLMFGNKDYTEASWIILHNGTMYHNSDAKAPHPLEFLNRPIIKAWLLYHKKWK
jgi:hypothetical protein